MLQESRKYKKQYFSVKTKKISKITAVWNYGLMIHIQCLKISNIFLRTQLFQNKINYTKKISIKNSEFSFRCFLVLFVVGTTCILEV